MKKNDVIKLGRVMLRVKTCCFKNCPNEFNNTLTEPLVKSKSCFTSGELCRVCHSEEDSIENPLLSICNCTGSMQFVHHKCLKTWLSYKFSIKRQDHLVSYYWKSFECEICKASYPSSIRHGEREYLLADVELPPSTNNYLVLETLFKSKSFSKAIHVLMPVESKSTFKIGRGHEVDVKIADMTVSRTHASIIMTEKGFALEDNQSKFGTLVLLKDEPQEIDADNGLTVQIDRTMVTFSLSQKDFMNLKGIDIQNAELADIYKRELGNT